MLDYQSLDLTLDELLEHVEVYKNDSIRISTLINQIRCQKENSSDDINALARALYLELLEFLQKKEQ